jgi:hypothetical protein
VTGSGRWFRLNTTWSQSEWLAALSPAARLTWVELLGYVKAHGYDGRVRSASPLVFGRMVGIPAESVTELLDAAQADGALLIEDGHWIITGWKDHQGDHTAGERMQRYRKKKEPKKPDSELRVTERNVTVATPRYEYRDKDSTTTTTAAGAAKVATGFDEAWKAYPRRDGDNPRKRAEKAWQARVRSGVLPEELLDGVKRYAAFVRAKGKEGTEYVMQAATFFGPDERWKSDYAARNGAAPEKPPPRVVAWSARPE